MDILKIFFAEIGGFQILKVLILIHGLFTLQIKVLILDSGQVDQTERVLKNPIFVVEFWVEAEGQF